MGSGDSLTVLHSTGDLYATKRLRLTKDGKIHKRSYGNAKHFRVRVIVITDFAAMCTALSELVREPFAFVIRGAPKPGINLHHSRRLLYPDRKTKDEATFAAAAHHWFGIDLDHVPAGPLVDPLTDPLDAIEYLIGLLPPEFAEVSCWWQFTSSQNLPGYDGLISARLCFWSETPLTDAELTRWAKAVNRTTHLIDPCLYRAVQAHYIAAPIFEDWTDPLPQRSGVRRGLEDSVSLVLPPPAPTKPEDIAAEGYDPGRGIDAHLAEIGSLAEGFRGPIRAAIASFIAIHGSKADCEELKKAIVKAVDAAVREGRAGERPDAVIDRYKSEDHLDELIAWIREHHGDRPPRGWTGDIPFEIIDPAIPVDGPTDDGINPSRETITLADFVAYLPQHNYLFVPTRELWPAASINTRLPWITIAGSDDKIPPSVWLDQNKPVEQMVWAPGKPMTIRDRVLSDGGWVEHEGITCFNLYKPSLLKKGNATKARRWIAHVEMVYPTDARHIIRWLAHRVQRPEDKLNHALVLGGKQGIGKDSLLEPVKRTVGPWNFAEPSPMQIMGRFNSFGRSVILRISEARDLGDNDRYAFYEHLKIYTVSPPDVLRVDEKNLREHNILNCCGVVITTNHLTDGVYLPADDRRHYVAWSLLTKDDFTEDYWNELWKFYDSGGDRHVAAYLAELDLKDFNPKAPPPKTEAFWTIVNAGRAPEDAELATIFELLGNPAAVTLRQLAATAEGTTSVDDDFAEWIRDRKNRRTMLYRLEACPKCQGLARAQWLADRQAELLPVPYFHVVFTMPAPIAGIALQNKAVVYDILFRAAAETVRTIAADPKHLGAATGMIAVLHTWGQNLFHHPHVHCVVPGGGLSPEGRWIACRPGFFLPVRVLSRLYRRLFLERLRTAFDAKMLGFFGELARLAKPAAFAAHLRPLRKVEWVVYAKRPFGGPQQALDYLGRYTHRVAIANTRLIGLAGGQVCFRWKDYRHPQRPKIMALPAGEFIRRFLLHVLPDGFRRIRHFGFLANAHRGAKLALIRRLLDLPEPERAPEPADYRERYARLFGRSLDICLACGGHLVEIAALKRTPRPARPFSCDSS